MAELLKLSRIDRNWLLASFLAFLPIFVFFVAKTIRHAYEDDYGHTPQRLAMDTLLAALGSLYVVGIPFRLGQNLLVKERRFTYRGESIALIVTFVALSAMSYAVFAYPPEG